MEVQGFQLWYRHGNHLLWFASTTNIPSLGVPLMKKLARLTLKKHSSSHYLHFFHFSGGK